MEGKNITLQKGADQQIKERVFCHNALILIKKTRRALFVSHALSPAGIHHTPFTHRDHTDSVSWIEVMSIDIVLVPKVELSHKKQSGNEEGESYG